MLMTTLKKIFMLDDANESYGFLNAFLKNKYKISSKNFREFKLDDLLIIILNI